MKANYHTHTYRCRHAEGKASDYVENALAAGLSVLGFSEHAPFPDCDYGYRMPYEELPAYCDEIDRMTAKYASIIVVRKGLEIEYLSNYRDYYEYLLTRHNFDYLLLGEHFYSTEGRTCFIADAKGTEENISYARGIAQALRTGYFSVVAHPDLFLRNQYAWDNNCDIATDLILNAALCYNVVLELNANGLRMGIHNYDDGPRYMYPDSRFWIKAGEAKVDVIIGSDCHKPSHVWDEHITEALRLSNKWGIKPLEHLEDRFPRR